MFSYAIYGIANENVTGMNPTNDGVNKKSTAFAVLFSIASINSLSVCFFKSTQAFGADVSPFDPAVFVGELNFLYVGSPIGG